MTNLKQMIEGRLYINRFSCPTKVYKKGSNGLLWYRDTAPKTSWKPSKASTKHNNFILVTDYGYSHDDDIGSKPGVTNTGFGCKPVLLGVMAMPV